MREVVVAATQMSCSWDTNQNIEKAESLVMKAISQNANIILLQELFETPYFCQEEKPEYFRLASSLEDNKAISHFRGIAKKYDVVLPISFFEKKNNAHYNSVAVIDTNGDVMGLYRKTHIPDGPGYEEKYYFNPGDTGFRTWKTKYGTIGIGICWDQWFPETARSLALMGAELLFYPTAIGSEPPNPNYDSRDHWQRCMQGHSAANIMPVIASNRIGTEKFSCSEITFYGSSFITDQFGAKIQEADRSTEAVLSAKFDLDELALQRTAWGIFRDRRPDLYKTMASSDGMV